MSPSATQRSRGRAWPKWIAKPLGWLRALAVLLFRVIVLGWGVLAIHYSNLPAEWARNALAAAFLVFGVWALWFARRPLGYRVFAGVLLALFVWWEVIPPSHDREWRPEVARMPRAIIDGDHVRIINYRNFDYRSRDDFTPRYEEREFLLSHVTGVDFYVSYWMPGPVGHTFLSFLFDDGPPLSISIETRPEVGEGFDPLASLFRQFELIYVVGSERDIVRVRTNYRHEDVYLYRVNVPAAGARKLLLIYLKRINELADKPEWYHLLSNNCTINIIRYSNKIGRDGSLNFRHVLNGWIDRYLYLVGKINTSLPFEELRRRSRINAAAEAADKAADFSEEIRKGLPSNTP